MDGSAFLHPLPVCPDGSPNFSLRALRRWLDELPVAHLGSTSGSLYEALQASNTLGLTPNQRLMMLETVKPALGFAVRRLRRRYDFTGRGLAPLTEQVHEFVDALLEEVARGYAQVIRDLVAAPKPEPQRLALSCQRAIRVLTVRLLERYRLYRTSPDGVWRDLHNLYAVAAEHGIQSRRVSEDGVTCRGRCSPGRAYRQALLLGAIDPYRISRQELDPLFGALKPLARLTHLRSTPPSAGSCYWVAPPQDIGPGRLAPPSRNAPALWLDCSKLQVVRPTALAATASDHAVDPGLLAQVQRHIGRWRGSQRRRPGREQRLAVGAGLGHIAELVAPSEVPPEDAVQSGVLVDFDTAGCCLRLTRPSGLRIGELVAFRAADQQTRQLEWQVAFVRRLLRQRDGLLIGVERLGTAAAAVQIVLDAGLTEETAQALWIKTGDTAALAVPQLNFLSDTTLLLQTQRERMTVSLKRELARTGCCQLFTTARAGHDPGETVVERSYRRLYARL